MKIKNQKIYSEDQEFLKRVAEDFDFIGRRYRLSPGLLTVFALQTRRKVKKVKTNTERNKRAESAGRHLTNHS